MQPIYLDYNATTPIAPSVQEAMQPFLSEHYGNPSSSHVLGRACHEAVDDARERVAALLGAESDEILFTSGGTESNNLAIKGVVWHSSRPKNPHIITSKIEHPAVAEPAKFLERLGCQVTYVGCNSDGIVDVAEIESAIRPETVLVSIMHANNETGVVQPISRIAAICRQRGILVHTDAAQSIGKIPTIADHLGVDLLTLAGHKVYAPKGVGALYVKRGTLLEPCLHGAAHEFGLRPGTENVPYIVALGQASVLAVGELATKQERMGELRNLLFSKMRKQIGQRLTFNGPSDHRLPNTLSVNFPDVEGAAILREASDVLASTGAACHSGHVGLSATLAAMGVDPEVGRGTVRLSLGWYTSQEQVDRAANLLIDAWQRLSSAA